MTPLARPPIKVIVCDDDRAVRGALNVNLSKAGYAVILCESAEEALERLRSEPIDVLLTDVNMPGRSGISLLGEVRLHWPDTRVVVMTGFGSVADAVSAMKDGAADYIIKPIGRDELLLLLGRALANRALVREVQQLRREVDAKYGFSNFVGASPVMHEVYAQVDAVADSNALVLVQGETGTGKELIAHALHYRSRRAQAPLVVVNCGALPETLLESELFGHEKGAFTGATRTHQGKFEQADGGTLFLDEIGEVPASVQVRLLRVLEGGDFTRVGGERPVKVDVRVIAATNRDLRSEVRTGAFRADLFYRLNVFPIRMPPLRARLDDIPLLARHFLQRSAQHHGRQPPILTLEAEQQLKRWRWPGNVRELEHLMERSLLLSGGGGEIRSFHMPEEAYGEDDVAGELGSEKRTPGESAPRLDDIDAGGLPARLDHWERTLIVAALEAEAGVQARAARRLGISRSNLNYRITRLAITLKDVKFA